VIGTDKNKKEQSSQRQLMRGWRRLVLETNMSVEALKGKPVRLYILRDDEPKLERLCEKSGLTMTSALTMIVKAGLEALEKNEYRVVLPLIFDAPDEGGKPYVQKPAALRLNEEKPAEKKSR
jgi:hypothetical protein